MDFTSQYQFAGSQPYQGGFMPMPPLTPSHSQSASDDYNGNNTSPPEGFESLAHGDQFQQFDYTQNLNAQHHPQPPPAFPGPPTPPFAQRQQQQQQQQQQQHLQAPNHQQQQPPSRNGSIHSGSGGTGADMLSLANGGTNPHGDALMGDEAQLVRGGSEDDDSMTPAQSRRKAQNRAAQRAFRERKEKHVKDLETKLANLEAAQEQSSVENERLKRDLQKMSTENEILRATTTSSTSSHSPPSAAAAAAAQHTGPMEYQPTDFYSNVLQNHTNKVPSHRIVTSDDGERLFAAGATWDYIISHELYKRGLVDVGGVSERLKNCARCDGQGPVFPEGAIIRAIEHSVASGSDDLL